MKPNIGNTDRTVRFILGAVILLIGLVTQSWWGLIGLIPIGTAAVRWCPFYAPLRISTIRKNRTA